METSLFFAYSWHIDPKEVNVTSMRIYGIGKNNENICIRVDDFTPFIYIELPDDIEWTTGKARLVRDAINEKLCEDSHPITSTLCYKYRLYYASMDKKKIRKKYPYLCCTFSSTKHINDLCYILKYKINIRGIRYGVKLKVHEKLANPLLQFASMRDIPYSGWIKFKGHLVDNDHSLTLCDKEYKVNWKNVYPYNNPITPKPLLMGLDIEVNSSNPSVMPDSKKPGDKVFQISCVLSKDANDEKSYEKYILSLGNPSNKTAGDDIIILKYKTESALLKGLADFIRKHKPNVIVGYNIFGFDIPYMIARSKELRCLSDFDMMGFTKYFHAQEDIIRWSSTAFGDQEFEYLKAEGIIFLDLLPYIKRDYKLSNYKLKTVSEFFLKDSTKDPLSVQGIFKCYKLGMLGGIKGDNALGICAKYCVQDSALVIKLCNVLKAWIGLCEMSNTCNIPMFDLYTKGQQHKTYAQVYKSCLYQNYVVEQDAYVAKENEHYRGAKVLEPISGIHDRVVPFDFCLSGDTLITLCNGTSKKIIDMVSDHSVLSCKNGMLDNYTSINGLQKKGNKETIKVFFNDGSSLVCTPDHKIMLDDGKWCEAQYLKGKYVTRGIEYAEDIPCIKEKKWTLDLGDIVLDMIENRSKALAFSRIVGYILTDGSIYTTMSKNKYNRCCAEAYFGTYIDAISFKNDLSYFTNSDINIRLRKPQINTPRSIKGVTYTINIPASFAKIIHKIPGIITGRRATQNMKLPDFILDSECPRSIIREFIAGMFGGDGSAPCLTSKNNFTSVGFKWTTIHSCLPNMLEIFQILSKLLYSFGIENSINNPISIKYGSNSIKPKDYEYNKRYDVSLFIKKDSVEKYSEYIGFRYCINKSYRLSIVKSYYKFCRRVREQMSYIINKSNEIIDLKIKNTLSRSKNQPTFNECVKESHKYLIDNEPILHKCVLLSSNNIGYYRGEEKRHPNRPRRISLKYKNGFPTPMEYLQDINALKWFDKKGYAVKQQDQQIPTYRLYVKDIRKNGILPVYDIEVKDSHNFIANGTIAHNCSLYPTTIIAYNICWSTIVKDDSDIPNRDCHVMEWEDHLGCNHDPLIIRKVELDKYIEKENTTIKKIREKRNNTLDKYLKKKYMKEIDDIKFALKPYMEERSDIVKRKVKHIMCTKRRYRFLKEPKGILPKLLEKLLSARAYTRKQIKVLENIQKTDDVKQVEADTNQDIYSSSTEMIPNYDIKTIKSSEFVEILDTLITVLNKRQLALKVSANSMYGIMGVTKGRLPFMPGAMCTTFKGREAIDLAAKTIVEKYKGKIVYGDTDSNYVVFPHKKTAEEIWDYSEHVASEISKMYPKPMALAFEQVIYWRFLMLTKKRYMSLSCQRDGIVSDKISKKGVLLARRDNSKIVRDIYSDVTMEIFYNSNRDDILYKIIQLISKICTGIYKSKDFTITKSVGKYSEIIEEYIDPKDNKKKGKSGNYTIPLLPENKEDRDKQFKLKNCESISEKDKIKEYYIKCLPSQVQLADRMKNRGKRVEVGTRLEYVVTDNTGHNGKLYNKIEDIDYFNTYSSVLRIDYLYYIKQLCKPIDQMLNFCFDNELYISDYKYKFRRDFVEQQYKLRLQKRKFLNDIEKLSIPKIIFK